MFLQGFAKSLCISVHAGRTGAALGRSWGAFAFALALLSFGCGCGYGSGFGFGFGFGLCVALAF